MAHRIINSGLMGSVYCYILITKTGRYYTGITKNLHIRFLQHCRSRSVFMRFNSPKEIVYSKLFSSYADARELEKYVKSIGAKKFLAKILPLKGKCKKSVESV